MMRSVLLLGIVVGMWSTVLGQSVYAPLNQDYYHLIDREEVLNKTVSPSLHTSYKPYRRVDIVTHIDSLSTNENNQHYLLNDNWEFVSEGEVYAASKKPFLKWFYRTKPDFLHVNQESFQLKVSPVLYLGLGIDDNAGARPFTNTRGVELRGSIDDKVGFYSYVGENQALFPQYVQDYTSTYGVVPNEAFWKKFGEDGAVDFFTARGYFTFQATKHIGIQFGHDKNFIGNGYRSMLLSDFSAPSTFLKIQTKVWRLQYTNLFTELVADAPYTTFGSNGTEVFPKKFMTAHHLSFNVTDNFNVGVFEAIIFHRGDSTSSAFEWNYLNPIIFYRSIEQFTGSPDNALFGLDFKWNIVKSVQLYGQGLLDELVVSELKAGNGWWGNKYSLQLGGKYYNVLGVKNLDLQAEYNLSRPFTYSHESIFTNYAHYRQPLAHPLGANFKELVLIARYQPIKYLFLTAKAIASDYGTDPIGQDFGGDVLKDYNERSGDYNYDIGGGVGNQVLYIDLLASYMLRHNLFIDLRHIYRNQDSDDMSLDQTTHFTSIAIRLNIAARDHSF
ncbi:Capsule assembly protein Wzi [Reichenbachiella agariperforans]|uniref:Capsule assembly protein Wzi n=1 Tax=Reichenbachiella agariperforans TaxID=156994 RepID=A0A1M6TII5_REIAG|nr:hypothetical protein [Reichenbachiella agariperforans]SHK56747.1 Capsule assembly protein Wzi [Reichenbachiella agariperforans]